MDRCCQCQRLATSGYYLNKKPLCRECHEKNHSPKPFSRYPYKGPGGDSFEPSPWDEIVVRQYEDRYE